MFSIIFLFAGLKYPALTLSASYIHCHITPIFWMEMLSDKITSTWSILEMDSNTFALTFFDIWHIHLLSGILKKGEKKQ